MKFSTDVPHVHCSAGTRVALATMIFIGAATSVPFDRTDINDRDDE